MDGFTLWDGTYQKETYLALIDGKAVPCWPNAGRMVSCDRSGRAWKLEDGIHVRVCTIEEHIAASCGGGRE